MTNKRKPAIKEVFDQHGHTQGFSPAMLHFDVEDRVAPGGARTLSGAGIIGVTRGFLEMRDGARIPLHKVLEIRRGDIVLFKRPRAARP